MNNETRSLIFQAIDKSLSPEGLKRLQHELRSDEHARLEYIKAINLTETLVERSTGIQNLDHQGSESRVDGMAGLLDATGDASHGTSHSESVSQVTLTNQTRESLFRQATFPSWLVAVVAAMVMVASLYAMRHSEFFVNGDSWLADESPDTHDLPKVTQAVSSQLYVAKVVSLSDDVVWNDNSAAPDFLLRTRCDDRLRIASGLVRLQYFSGAEFLLRGPCIFATTGERSGRLEYGSLTGVVDDGDFWLTTPSAQVLGFGREFGVSVDDQAGTDVHVFNGVIQVDSAEPTNWISLTDGMSARIELGGAVERSPRTSGEQFTRHVPSPIKMSMSEVSLVDLVSATTAGHFGLAGVIAPDTGSSDRGPWLRVDGPGNRMHQGFQLTSWHPYVDGVFIPPEFGQPVQYSSEQGTIELPFCSGRTWGPIWSRRRVEGNAVMVARDDYWGTLTLERVSHKLQQSETGLIGLHSNAGITFDLNAVRDSVGNPMEFVCSVCNLDNSSETVNDDKWRRSKRFSADVQVFVDGQRKASRPDLTRQDGDVTLRTPIELSDRFLTIVTTDHDGFNGFDHVVLVDPVLKLAIPK
ncbi:hypothetical protein SAMN06265222_1011060 [Neorhodopirellula lusitana]|uniref:FecR protein n=1 Tax=Neorhodopirellula lusitana TaxID=445327 RepID=A0ABY1PRP0_9BACT|nr:hypothetical protein [Neorhodopirellula lusitana]SMP44024.1 hypothetical protein SAMN06265222_1011060 [Neorhodopirellula lusitana]